MPIARPPRSRYLRWLIHLEQSHDLQLSEAAIGRLVRFSHTRHARQRDPLPDIPLHPLIGIMRVIVVKLNHGTDTPAGLVRRLCALLRLASRPLCEGVRPGLRCHRHRSWHAGPGQPVRQARRGL